MNKQNASSLPDRLILKTYAARYIPGHGKERKRAVKPHCVKVQVGMLPYTADSLTRGKFPAWPAGAYFQAYSRLCQATFPDNPAHAEVRRHSFESVGNVQVRTLRSSGLAGSAFQVPSASRLAVASRSTQRSIVRAKASTILKTFQLSILNQQRNLDIMVCGCLSTSESF